MLPKETVEQLLAEAENRLAELDSFRMDSADLGLEVIEKEFVVMKKFYQERVDILKTILMQESLPF